MDHPSQTASDYIEEQLALEADAKEVLPYKFDKCTYELGALRQSVFACLTCNPPPASAAQVYTPAGVCYACSISCHSEHNLVELFHRRNFTCDCGTTRISSTPCTLRLDNATNRRGARNQPAAGTNKYNQNFQNKFCGCQEEYDADTQKGTMYQCIGLNTEEEGGCGEDWWHAECLMGLSKDWHEKGTTKAKEMKTEVDQNVAAEHPVPASFPDEEDFSTLICYKCVERNPWIKPYAGTDGFLPPLFHKSTAAIKNESLSAESGLKRKASDDDPAPRSPSPAKRTKSEALPSALLGESDEAILEAEDTTLTSINPDPATATPTGLPSAVALSEAKHKHDRLPVPPTGMLSIFGTETFRDSFCHCPACFPNLLPYPQLQEEEDDYEPSLSDSEQSAAGGGSARSVGTGSLLERGEAALSNVDRVRAIEGVMAYNHLKDKVKEFLRPYAESGQAVGAEDIKAYFEKLRGDEIAIREAAERGQ